MTVEASTAVLRKAKMADAPAIQRLITLFASRDEMLHRSLGEVYESIRNFFVVEETGEILACGALQVSWSNLAEIKSLAVAEAHQGRGHGRRLVLACVEEGRALGLGTLFALTYKPGFFEKLGFHVVDKATLPHKVWNECIRCPKFPDCGEIAVVLDLE
jgi:amino-acid N-acetyltransferase